MTDSHKPPLSWSGIVTAGAIGGFAEVLWISLYTALTPSSAAEIARAVTVTALGNTAGEPMSPLAPVLGLLIHMALAVAVAAAFAATLWRPATTRFGTAGVVAASVAVLSAIWLVNFFVVLPGARGAFAALLPLPVSYTSKALFGIAMGITLCRIPQASSSAPPARPAAAHR